MNPSNLESQPVNGVATEKQSIFQKSRFPKEFVKLRQSSCSACVSFSVQDPCHNSISYRRSNNKQRGPHIRSPSSFSFF